MRSDVLINVEQLLVEGLVPEQGELVQFTRFMVWCCVIIELGIKLT